MKNRFFPAVVCACLCFAVANAIVVSLPDGPLEPSLANEVERAVGMGAKFIESRMAAAGDVFATNGLSRLDIARKIVSLQKIEHGRGYWIDPRPCTVSNRLDEISATRLALEILKGL